MHGPFNMIHGGRFFQPPCIFFTERGTLALVAPPVDDSFAVQIKQPDCNFGSVKPSTTQSSCERKQNALFYFSFFNVLCLSDHSFFYVLQRFYGLL